MTGNFLKPIKIGSLTIEKNVFLAPMAGITDLAYRLMCRKYGCAFTYTEMISSKALFYNDKKTFTLLQTQKDDLPFGVQIFGSAPSIMSSTLYKAISTGASLVDINMGCPAPKIVNNGEGSALMKSLTSASKIIEEVKKVSPVPVTVKFRKGFDDSSINAIEFARMAESSGADAICVHGRTREQYYSGEADWNILANIKSAVKIPVIGNGDIKCADDACDMFSKTGVDGIMVARGSRGRPYIFREIDELLTHGHIIGQMTNRQKVDDAIEHIKLKIDYKGEYIGTREGRGQIAYYIKGIKDSARIKDEINHANTMDEMTALLEKLLELQNEI